MNPDAFIPDLKRVVYKLVAYASRIAVVCRKVKIDEELPLEEQQRRQKQRELRVIF